jgi:hypothetical protein
MKRLCLLLFTLALTTQAATVTNYIVDSRGQPWSGLLTFTPTNAGYATATSYVAAASFRTQVRTGYLSQVMLEGLYNTTLPGADLVTILVPSGDGTYGMNALATNLSSWDVASYVPASSNLLGWAQIPTNALEEVAGPEYGPGNPIPAELVSGTLDGVAISNAPYVVTTNLDVYGPVTGLGNFSFNDNTSWISNRPASNGIEIHSSSGTLVVSGSGIVAEGGAFIGTGSSLSNLTAANITSGGTMSGVAVSNAPFLSSSGTFTNVGYLTTGQLLVTNTGQAATFSGDVTVAASKSVGVGNITASSSATSPQFRSAAGVVTRIGAASSAGIVLETTNTVTIAKDLLLTNGNATISGTITATNGVSGSSGCVILSTNRSINLIENTYTNVWNCDYTKAVGAMVVTATNSLVVPVAGTYRIGLFCSFSTDVAEEIECAVFTNNVECPLIEFVRTTSVNGIGAAASEGQIALPAGCIVQARVKTATGSGNGVLTVRKYSLIVGGAN